MNYVITTLLLILVVVAFFALARGRYRHFGGIQIGLRVLVALPLLLSGIVLHFFRMQDTIGIVPPVFPAARFLVELTGILEVLGAIGLFVPAFRTRAGFLLAVMMIAIFPANVYAAGRMVGGMQMPGVPVRTVMQVVFMVMILFSSFGLPSGMRSKRPSEIP
jgi:uncharacterized membrane protein